MSRQRQISDGFWRDPDLADLSHEDKVTLLYCLTNPYSNVLGVYRIIPRISASEMGWTADQLATVLMRLKEKDLIRYRDDGWLWVRIWWRHNVMAVALKPTSNIYAAACREFTEIPAEWAQEYLDEVTAKGYTFGLQPIASSKPLPSPLGGGGGSSKGKGYQLEVGVPASSPIAKPAHGTSTTAPPKTLHGVRVWTEADVDSVSHLVKLNGELAVVSAAERLKSSLGKMPLPSEVENYFAAEALRVERNIAFRAKNPASQSPLSDADQEKARTRLAAAKKILQPRNRADGPTTS